MFLVVFSLFLSDMFYSVHATHAQGADMSFVPLALAWAVHRAVLLGNMLRKVQPVKLGDSHVFNFFLFCMCVCLFACAYLLS